jgi:hypothetical protein
LPGRRNWPFVGEAEGEGEPEGEGEREGEDVGRIPSCGRRPEANPDGSASKRDAHPAAQNQ